MHVSGWWCTAEVTLLSLHGCAWGNGVMDPSPGCSSPAPLSGTAHPEAPGYIETFRDGNPARPTTERLAARYGFTPRYIYEHALLGFSAELSAQALAGVRCEEVGQSVEHDGTVRGGG